MALQRRTRLRHRFIALLAAAPLLSLLSGCAYTLRQDEIPKVAPSLAQGKQKLPALVIPVFRIGERAATKSVEHRIGEPLIIDGGREGELVPESVELRNTFLTRLFKQIELAELCFLFSDGAVLSLSRTFTEGHPSAGWRQKSVGRLIEPGREFLAALFQERRPNLRFPGEVLSACSFGNRKALAHWSDKAQMRAFTFVASIPPLTHNDTP